MEEKMKNLKEMVVNEIENFVQDGHITNLDAVSKLVDIHKDISNEEYWEKKKEVIEMRYDDYDNYGRRGNYGRRSRDSRGRYTAGRRYRGDDMMEEMRKHYERYHDGREEYERGNYGAKSDTIESLECMMESVVDFVEMLKKDANSPEEMEIIRKHAEEISEM